MAVMCEATYLTGFARLGNRTIFPYLWQRRRRVDSPPAAAYVRGGRSGRCEPDRRAPLRARCGLSRPGWCPRRRLAPFTDSNHGVHREAVARDDARGMRQTGRSNIGEATRWNRASCRRHSFSVRPVPRCIAATSSGEGGCTGRLRKKWSGWSGSSPHGTDRCAELARWR